MSLRQEAAAARPNADHRFVDYYERQSLSASSSTRFDAVMRRALAVRARFSQPTAALKVADVGCGPGVQSLMWAAAGHRVVGIDISAPLVRIAAQRATEARLPASFGVGSATALPFADHSFDIVLAPELLEHVADWKRCLSEACRILRPGGVVYLCTTNRLCPIQQEFALPAYSWYPASLKRRCERLAVTTKGHWVQYTSFPAVNWFSPYQLRRELLAFGIDALDRFDAVEPQSTALRRIAVGAVRKLPLLRFAGHVLTPYTVVYGVKRLPNAR